MLKKLIVAYISITFACTLFSNSHHIRENGVRGVDMICPSSHNTVTVLWSRHPDPSSIFLPITHGD